MKMASRYKFSADEIKAIEEARKVNKDKRAEARLKALELRAKGKSSNDVAKETGFHPAYVTRLVAKYRDNGLEAISGNHYGGNHRNMSVEEEARILAPFLERENSLRFGKSQQFIRRLSIIMLVTDRYIVSCIDMAGER